MKKSNVEALKYFAKNLPKHTREEKIIIKALQLIDRAIFESDRSMRNSSLRYAQGLLEALIMKDDKERSRDGEENDSH